MAQSLPTYFSRVVICVYIPSYSNRMVIWVYVAHPASKTASATKLLVQLRLLFTTDSKESPGKTSLELHHSGGAT